MCLCLSVCAPGLSCFSLTSLRGSFFNVFVLAPQPTSFSSHTQTLTLFGMLRGLSGAQLTEVVHTTITEVGLTTHAAALASTLSGGQKRRLSLGMALVGPDGGPRLLVLDEVCAGIDAQGRHDVWALLRRKKQGRVIILTTHNMMEADVLADRIVVLSRGKLQVAGSTLFLKSRWGLGYVLSVTTPDVDAVVEAVSRHVPQATLVPTSSSSSSSFASVPFKGFDADDSSGAVRTSDVAVSVGAGSGAGAAAGANPLPGGPTQELSFRLPRECSDEFPALLEALDAMGLNRLYGLSATTLEDGAHPPLCCSVCCSVWCVCRPRLGVLLDVPSCVLGSVCESRCGPTSTNEASPPCFRRQRPAKQPSH